MMLSPRHANFIDDLQAGAGSTLRVPYFFSLHTHQTMEEILEHPHAWFIEEGEHDIVQSQLFHLLGQKPDFAINATSRTAYHHTVALSIADSIHHRFGIQKYRAMQIHTCLQEAILNAIIHGNLCVESRFDTLQGFEHYFAEIQSKLDQPEYGNRRVMMAAWYQDAQLKFAVSDQGSGFALDGRAMRETLPHGRGIALIRSLSDGVWVGQDGRTLWISFDMKTYA